MTEPSLFHIVRADLFESAQLTGEYRPERYASDGFIHCSYLEQVVGVAKHLYRGHQDLVLLQIDPEALDAVVVDENLEGGENLFPHIYGPLPTTAVVAVHQLPARPDGLFELPLTLRRLND